MIDCTEKNWVDVLLARMEAGGDGPDMNQGADALQLVKRLREENAKLRALTLGDIKKAVEAGITPAQQKAIEAAIKEAFTEFLDQPALLEELAAIEHARWAHWMEYLFACCSWKEDPPPVRFGAMDVLEPARHLATIPSDKVERWQRQVEQSYAQLSEKERESDRVEVRKTLAAIKKFSEAP